MPALSLPPLAQWSPIYDISAILTSIQSLLCDPNPNSPANSEAARLYQVRPRGGVAAARAKAATARAVRPRALTEPHARLLRAVPCGGAQENRREYERKVKEIVEQSWAAEAAE